jgi:serine/threonine protein kinase
MIKILTEPPRNPSEINPLFPEEARPIIERAMAPNPIHRFASAMEMLHEIRQLPAFQNGRQALIAVAGGIVNRQCATGDLGCAKDSAKGNEVAVQVLNSLSFRNSHTSRSSLSGRLSRFITGPKDRKSKVLIGCVLIVLMGMTFLVTGVGKSAWKNEADAQVVPVPPTNPEPVSAPSRNADEPLPRFRDEIRIRVSGMPPRSTIFFNDVSVPANQFFVPTEKKASRLTVEAPGYAPFNAEVIPDKDLSIEVEMLPVLVRASLGKASKRTPAAAASGNDSPDSYIQGRRKTEFLKDFE